MSSTKSPSAAGSKTESKQKPKNDFKYNPAKSQKVNNDILVYDTVSCISNFLDWDRATLNFVKANYPNELYNEYVEGEAENEELMDDARLLEKYPLGMLLNESDENLSAEVMETINDIPEGDARRVALAAAIARHQSRIKQQNQITALKNAMISEKSKTDTKKEYKLP